MAVTLEITPTYMALKGGEFDTRYKYMALDNVSPNLYMVAGPTISSQRPATSGLTITFKSGGLAVDFINGSTVPVLNSTTGVGT